MRQIARYVLWSAVAAVVLIMVGYLVLPPPERASYWGNLWGSIGSGFVGTVVGLVVGVWVASRIANDKFALLGPHIIEFIKQLRNDGALSPHAARAAVVISVGALAEDTFSAPVNGHSKICAQNCSICTLDYEAEPDHKGTLRCIRCKAPEPFWNNGSSGSNELRQLPVFPGDTTS